MSDEKVQSQKVYVKLSGVVSLTNELHRVRNELDLARKANGDDLMGFAKLVSRKQALVFALDTLELPIP